MVTTFDDFRSFSTHDLKRLGFLQNYFCGILNWLRGSEVTSSIRITAFLSSQKSCLSLWYRFNNGETVSDEIYLQFVKSNLGRGGYWMFICPVTGKCCRKLYLHNGHFKSRAALPPGILYESQNVNMSFRPIRYLFQHEDQCEALEKAISKPYAKKTYRGKPTRLVKRLENKWRHRNRIGRLVMAMKL